MLKNKYHYKNIIIRFYDLYFLESLNSGVQKTNKISMHLKILDSKAPEFCNLKFLNYKIQVVGLLNVIHGIISLQIPKIFLKIFNSFIFIDICISYFFICIRYFKLVIYNQEENNFILHKKSSIEKLKEKNSLRLKT